jgi:hypothetical protein
MNKTLIWTIVAGVAALVIYDLVVKKFVLKSSFEDEFEYDED